MFYGDREGTLLVRGMLGDLDIIEGALQNLKNLEAQHEVYSPALQGPAARPGAPTLTRTNGSPGSVRTNASQRPNEFGLFTRMFKLDPETIKNGLNEIGTRTGSDGSTRPSAEATETTLRDFLTKAGADLAPPRAIFWNDREGTLLIRASLHDLDLIEQALQVLNASTRQVNVKIKFVEIDDVAARHLLDGRPLLNGVSLVTNSTSPSIAEGTVPRHPQDFYGIHPPTNSVVVTVAGILTTCNITISCALWSSATVWIFSQSQA